MVSPIITYILLSLTVLISLSAFPPNVSTIESLRHPELFHKLKFNPYMVWHSREWYRLFTSGFVHSGWFHLLVNMFVLYFFGRTVEEAFVKIFGGFQGHLLFLLLYLTGLAASNIPDLLRFRNQYYYNAVGASGAISAVLFASILFFPWAGIYIFPIPIPIPAILFGVIYLGYEYYMKKRAMDNIGHNAHFWGAVWGFIFPIFLKPSLFVYFLHQLF